MAPRRLLDSLSAGGAGRRFVVPVVLGLAVAVLLVEGALHRTPAPAADEAAPASGVAAPAPTATPFRPELEKVPLMYFSDYWLQLASRARSGLLTLGPARVPAVRMRPGFALLTLDDADLVGASPEDAPEGSLAAADARVGIALFRIDPAVQADPLTPATGLHAGMLVALVSLDPERGLQVTPGSLVSQPSETSDELEVSLRYPTSLGVGVIVDLDGLLAGVAIRTRDGVRALSVRGASTLADRLVAAPVCRGVEVASLDESLRKGMRLASGVVVQKVWPGAFPQAPDILPGDVLLRWGGRDLSTPESFYAAYDALPPGQAARFALRRGDRRLTGEVEMPGRDGRPIGMAPADVPWLDAIARIAQADAARGSEPGLLILHVTEGGPADRAGLESGDLVTRVDDRPVRWPTARRLLQSSPGPAPSVLLVERGETTRLALLRAAEG